MRLEIRIAGFGGQGVVLAGYVLGKALALYSDREAVMTQSYGPEARGGASSADVVVSTEPIAYPFVQQPDYLVALSQESYTKFRPTIRPDAMVLIDQDLVNPQDGDQIHAIPATQPGGGFRPPHCGQRGYAGICHQADGSRDPRSNGQISRGYVEFTHFRSKYQCV